MQNRKICSVFVNSFGGWVIHSRCMSIVDAIFFKAHSNRIPSRPRWDLNLERGSHSWILLPCTIRGQVFSDQHAFRCKFSLFEKPLHSEIQLIATSQWLKAFQVSTVSKSIHFSKIFCLLLINVALFGFYNRHVKFTGRNVWYPSN